MPLFRMQAPLWPSQAPVFCIEAPLRTSWAPLFRMQAPHGLRGSPLTHPIFIGDGAPLKDGARAPMTPLAREGAFRAKGRPPRLGGGGKRNVGVAEFQVEGAPASPKVYKVTPLKADSAAPPVLLRCA